MTNIELQTKTKAQSGRIEYYWFENRRIGLKKTLFHRIYIPLKPFDSDLEYVHQPEETEIVFEWLKLDQTDPKDLDGLLIDSRKYNDLEASVYIGHSHHPCEVKMMEFKKIEEDLFKVKCELLIDFEGEGVGNNETFRFQTTITFN